MFQMFERETRREKILEARNKELRLKEKTKGILGLGGGLLGGGGGDAMAKQVKQAQQNKDTVGAKDDGGDGGGGGDDKGAEEDEYEDPIVKAEREFFQIIKQEQDVRLEARKQKQGTEDTTE